MVFFRPACAHFSMNQQHFFRDLICSNPPGNTDTSPEIMFFSFCCESNECLQCGFQCERRTYASQMALGPFPESTKSPNRVCFGRKKLVKSIYYYVFSLRTRRVFNMGSSIFRRFRYFSMVSVPNTVPSPPACFSPVCASCLHRSPHSLCPGPW